MRYLAFFFALIVSGCAAAPVGECPVIIGPSQYEYLATQLVGDNNGGASLISPTYDDLYDTHPSTLTRFEYNTSGSQTTSSVWGIEIFLAPHGEDTPAQVSVGMVAVLNTSLPAGAVVQIYDSNLIGDQLASGTMQLDPNGITTSAWLLFTNRDTGGVVVAFRNNNGGSTYMSNGYDLTIGEIRVSEAIDLDIKRNVKISYVGPNKQRKTSSGLNMDVIQPAIRTMTLDSVPIEQAEAINNGPDDMLAVFSEIFTGTVAMFVPWEKRDPALYTEESRNSGNSQTIRAKTAFLGSFNQAPSITMNGDKYYEISMSVTESI